MADEVGPNPEPSMPADPVSDLVGMAAMHHETYEAYKKAGFSPAEALTLVVAWITRPASPQ